MDFALDDEQRELVALAQRVFTDLAPSDRVVEVEQGDDRVDARLWYTLAETGLLGLAIDERWGGSAGGAAGRTVGLALLLEAQARHVAPVPLYSTLLLGAHPLQRHGDGALRERWLPGIAAGTAVLTGAYRGTDPDRHVAPVTARHAGNRLVLSGWLPAVPAGHVAQRVLVPVRAGGCWRLALVDPAADGVACERVLTTDRSVQAHLTLAEASVEEWMNLSDGELAEVLDHARIGLCAQQLGVAEAALTLTAAHVSSRRQFGREIGTFQAVAQRAADAYIDTEALRCTALRASWLLAEGWPARAETAAAAWWAARAGHRVSHTAMHLHGGLGNDVEYPLHRYFLWARQLGLMLGGTGGTLAELAALVPGID
jgi:alkylation response protein AidB-like acyl-CoA dehydrogenase